MKLCALLLAVFVSCNQTETKENETHDGGIWLETPTNQDDFSNTVAYERFRDAMQYFKLEKFEDAKKVLSTALIINTILTMTLSSIPLDFVNWANVILTRQCFSSESIRYSVQELSNQRIIKLPN